MMIIDQDEELRSMTNSLPKTEESDKRSNYQYLDECYQREKDHSSNESAKEIRTDKMKMNIKNQIKNGDKEIKQKVYNSGSEKIREKSEEGI